MRAQRTGYTILELMMAMAVFAIIAAIAYPRFHEVVRDAALRSSRQEMAAYLVRARAAALQRGRQTYFIRDGDAVRVAVDSSGTQVPLFAALDLRAEHGVSVVRTTFRDTIAFDPRGYAVGLGATEVIAVTREGARDSVCVTKLGKVIAQGCAL
jgi:prepilin-type N-terminal cleavage/methylation domain-containing protein